MIVSIIKCKAKDWQDQFRKVFGGYPKDATLQDVVKPNQIIYRCASKLSKYYNLSISLDDIDKAILKALKNFKIGKKEFDEYINFTNSQLSNIIKTTKEKVASKNQELKNYMTRTSTTTSLSYIISIANQYNMEMPGTNTSAVSYGRSR